MKNEKQTYSMLILAARSKLAEKAASILKEENIPVQYMFRGQGTASSEIMSVLGLGGIEKTVLSAVMQRATAEVLIDKLKRSLYLGMPDTGIAFTLSLSGGSGRLFGLIDEAAADGDEEKLSTEREGNKTMDNEYNLLVTIVDQGFSDEVMNAARTAGATGGTVFHARRVGSEEAMKFWGISIQQGRECVLILARKEDKIAIMQAIGEKCGMQSQAHGIVLSLPVDGVAGL